MLAQTLAVGLSIVAAYAGCIKVRHRGAFRRVVISWGLPLRFSVVVAWALPLSELAVAGLLVLAAVSLLDREEVVYALVAAYFIILVGGQIWIRRRASTAECGCFGRPRPIGASSILTALVLGASAALAAVIASGDGLT